VRIRSIKPEFWRSDDIAALSIEDRLLFIGLWSYVDDSGVGVDKVSHIVADLFAPDAERDFREAYGRVTGGLATLSDRGLITRYTVDGKPFLYITTWSAHQRIEKPSKARFPAPTCENAVIREGSGRTPVALPEGYGYGAGEQGNRGTGEQSLSSTADAPDQSEAFEEFWSLYPRKVAKGAAVKAWKSATRKADAETITAALKAQTPALIAKGSDFCPHAATWLNAERWTDETTAAGAPDHAEPVAGFTAVEDIVAARDWGPQCPECERQGGQHFRGCSQAAS
jgi:hypothetical protein